MKILVKRNNHLNDTKYRVECYCCGSVLEYDKNDLSPVMDPYGKGVEMGKEITCPNCDVHIRHKESNRDIKR